MSTPNTLNWSAVFAHPRTKMKEHEQFVSTEHIAYLPLAIIVKQWSGKKGKVKTPSKSSYIFIQIDKQYVLNIFSTIGILKHVRKLVTVRGDEKENLNILLYNDENTHLVENTNFFKGDKVIKDFFSRSNNILY